MRSTFIACALGSLFAACSSTTTALPDDLATVGDAATRDDASIEADLSAAPSCRTDADCPSGSECVISNFGEFFEARCTPIDAGVGTGADLSSPAALDAAIGPGAVQVTAGFSHVCALLTTGSIKCWGNNQSGQIGDGTTEKRLTPTEVGGLGGTAISVSAGGDHTCALLSGGTVRCWGSLGTGGLGDGTIAGSIMPVDVAGLGGAAIAISAGYGNTCAILATGALRCWGINGYGQVGDGSDAPRASPVDTIGLPGAVSAVSVGGLQTCAVASGTVYCWGYGFWGALGTGTTDNHKTPVAIALDGTATQVSSGFSETCALLSSGSVRCWGLNSTGSVGNGNTMKTIAPAVATALGTATATSIAVGTCATIGNGAVRCWGPYAPGVDLQLGENPVSIAASTGGACAALPSGGVRCWGSIYLGDGMNTASSATPVTPVTFP